MFSSLSFLVQIINCGNFTVILHTEFKQGFIEMYFQLGKKHALSVFVILFPTPIFRFDIFQMDEDTVRQREQIL